MRDGLPERIDRLGEKAAGRERGICDRTDRTDRAIDGREQPIDDLWIAIDRGQRAIDDAGDVIEPHAKLDARLDAFDRELDLVELASTPAVKDNRFASFASKFRRALRLSTCRSISCTERLAR